MVTPALVDPAAFGETLAQMLERRAATKAASGFWIEANECEQCASAIRAATQQEEREGEQDAGPQDAAPQDAAPQDAARETLPASPPPDPGRAEAPMSETRETPPAHEPPSGTLTGGDGPESADEMARATREANVGTLPPPIDFAPSTVPPATPRPSATGNVAPSAPEWVPRCACGAGVLNDGDQCSRCEQSTPAPAQADALPAAVEAAIEAHADASEDVGLFSAAKQRLGMTA